MIHYVTMSRNFKVKFVKENYFNFNLSRYSYSVYNILEKEVPYSVQN